MRKPFSFGCGVRVCLLFFSSINWGIGFASPRYLLSNQLPSIMIIWECVLLDLSMTESLTKCQRTGNDEICVTLFYLLVVECKGCVCGVE